MNTARSSAHREEPPWNGTALALASIGAPVAVLNSTGWVLGLSPQAQELLTSVGIATKDLPFALPASLWAALSAADMGEAIEWHPDARAVPKVRNAFASPSDHDAAPAEGAPPSASLGCTRYPLGPDFSISLMREVSAKRVELHRRLHRQRLEHTGRLVAAIAHDVRTSVASILYNADWMASSVSRLTGDELVETAGEIHTASRRLQAIVDRLLDFAKLGPPVTDDISLRDVLRRVVALVRPVYRDGGHAIQTIVHGEADSVRGNALVIDQILVNLLVNAAEAARRPLSVRISTEPVATPVDVLGSGPDLVRIILEDDGPGIPEAVRERVFQPFFTTRPDGTGLGLTTAREAAEELGGSLVLEPSDVGARFAVTLPAGRTPRESP